jgi:hypothetical protein
MQMAPCRNNAETLAGRNVHEAGEDLTACKSRRKVPVHGIMFTWQDHERTKYISERTTCRRRRKYYLEADIGTCISSLHEVLYPGEVKSVSLL